MRINIVDNRVDSDTRYHQFHYSIYSKSWFPNLITIVGVNTSKATATNLTLSVKRTYSPRPRCTISHERPLSCSHYCIYDAGRTDQEQTALKGTRSWTRLMQRTARWTQAGDMSRGCTPPRKGARWHAAPYKSTSGQSARSEWSARFSKSYFLSTLVPPALLVIVDRGFGCLPISPFSRCIENMEIKHVLSYFSSRNPIICTCNRNDRRTN